jgi:hypothetical protein
MGPWPPLLVRPSYTRSWNKQFPSDHCSSRCTSRVLLHSFRTTAPSWLYLIHARFSNSAAMCFPFGPRLVCR